MSAVPFPRWTDDRLDDMKRRLDGMEPTVNGVGELRIEMRQLARELEVTNRSLGKFSEQFEEAQKEPITRVRNFYSQVAVAVVAATVGGGLAILGAVVAAGAH
jgi:hypothetical protein